MEGSFTLITSGPGSGQGAPKQAASAVNPWHTKRSAKRKATGTAGEYEAADEAE